MYSTVVTCTKVDKSYFLLVGDLHSPLQAGIKSGQQGVVFRVSGTAAAAAAAGGGRGRGLRLA